MITIYFGNSLTGPGSIPFSINDKLYDIEYSNDNRIPSVLLIKVVGDRIPITSSHEADIKKKVLEMISRNCRLESDPVQKQPIRKIILASNTVPETKPDNN